MSDDFKQTVDLKEKFEKNKSRTSSQPQKISKEKEVKKIKEKPKKKAEKKAEKKSINNKASEIDKVFKDKEFETKNELHTINFPVRRTANDAIVKQVATVAIFLLILVGAFWYFVFNKGNDMGIGHRSSNASENQAELWYAVKLLNDEVYYGQIADISADPIVINNVYYNYDQLNKEGTKVSETGSLRLVKRGKETHGPQGSMNIVRAQVVYMEPMKEDSKVLKAILDYEKD